MIERSDSKFFENKLLVFITAQNPMLDTVGDLALAFLIVIYISLYIESSSWKN